MTDSLIRELERAWRASGDRNDELAFLQARARAGLPWVFVRSLWTVFDLQNTLETRPSFRELLDRYQGSLLLIDLTKLRNMYDFWPVCVGPLSDEEKEDWPRLRERWVLTGVKPKIRVVMDMLFPQPPRMTERCPADGGALDLDRPGCAVCGEFPLVVWGPEGIRAGQS